MGNQKGTAIITALFIMAIVAIAATAMSMRLQIDIRRTELTLTADKNYLLAQGVVYWASGVLLDNIKNKSTQTIQDNRIDDLPKKFTSPDYQASQVSGSVEDAQNKYNINNLIDSKNIPSFVQLLKAIEPKLNDSQANTIAKSISQWIKPGSKSNDDQSYLNANPPYRPAHRLMSNISELRLVKGITRDLFLKVQPYLTALPTQTKVNINTPLTPVLLTLSPKMSTSQAVQIINAGSEAGGFKTMKQFQSNAVVKKLKIPNNDYIINSDFFIVQALVMTGHQQLALSSLLHREKLKKKNTVTVIWENR